MPAMVMKHETDPADVLWKKLGNISGFQVMHNNVVVAVYDRPKQTQGGLHLPDQYRDEEKYQGKAALVIAMGPSAWRDSDNWNFSAVPVVRGDWVAIRASDGWDITVNGVLCRMLPDTAIRAKISAPDLVW